MNKVKFHFADNGFVELATGKSSFSDLFVLGALQLTSKINCHESCYEYPTDIKSEEPKQNLHELAWLLVGLTELSSGVAHNNAEMNHTLSTKKPD